MNSNFSISFFLANMNAKMPNLLYSLSIQISSFFWIRIQYRYTISVSLHLSSETQSWQESKSFSHALLFPLKIDKIYHPCHLLYSHPPSNKLFKVRIYFFIFLKSLLPVTLTISGRSNLKLNWVDLSKLDFNMYCTVIISLFSPFPLVLNNFLFWFLKFQLCLCCLLPWPCFQICFFNTRATLLLPYSSLTAIY